MFLLIQLDLLTQFAEPSVCRLLMPVSFLASICLPGCHRPW